MARAVGEEQRPATCTVVLADVYRRAAMIFAAGGGDRAAAVAVRDGAADFAHK